MNLEEYAKYDGLGLAELIRRKEVKPSELVDLALRAIQQVNPKLNAVIAPIIKSADQVAEATLPEGPFRGVPFLIKDLVVHAAGIATDMGSRFTQNIEFPHDTELMARFRKAGLVTIGRTNTPEFGYNANTAPVLHGPTRNPWDPSKSAGGSSGGSAAAVAARIVPWAHANDGGGSIRIPASACGLVGLKPTRGRVSLGPDFGEALLGLACEHVVTRTVRDCAAMLDAVQGSAPGEPYIITPPKRPYLEEAETSPGKLKIAFTTTGFNGRKSDPACVAAVEESARRLESLGHTIVEGAPQVNFEAMLVASVPAWTGWVASAVETIRQLMGRTPTQDNLEATTWTAYQYGLKASALDVLNSVALYNQIRREVAPFFEEHDILMTPTMPTPLVEIDYYNADDRSLDARGWVDKLFNGWAHFTGVVNVTGQPAISLPLQQASDGLPIGIHFVGSFGDEATLFRLAGQLEQAAPWIDRKPPISI